MPLSACSPLSETELLVTEKVTVRKGDLILVERVSRNSYSVAAHLEAKAAGCELPSSDTSYTFGVVASATRDGIVKTWQAVGYRDELLSTYAQPIGTGERHWTMPRKAVDISAVLAAAKAHHWPGHPGQPRPFATLEEATAVARSFRLSASGR